MIFENFNNQLLSVFKNTSEDMQVKEIIDKVDYLLAFPKNIENDFVLLKNKKELVIFLRILLNLSLNKAITIKKLKSKISLSDYHEKDVEKFFNSFNGYSTHPIKANNPIDFISNINSKVDCDNSKYGISTATILEATRHVVFSENAALLGYRTIVSSVFYFEGVKTSFIDFIANNKSVACDILNEVGFKGEHLDKMISISCDLINEECEYAQSVQIYSPFLDVNDKVEYELITPVPSSQMQRFVNRSIREYKTLGVNSKDEHSDPIVNLKAFDSGFIKDYKSPIIARNFSPIYFIVFEALKSILYFKNCDRKIIDLKDSNLNDVELNLFTSNFSDVAVEKISNYMYKFFYSNLVKDSDFVSKDYDSELNRNFNRIVKIVINQEHKVSSFIKSSDYKIGGAQAQNISDLNARFSGHNKHYDVDLSYANGRKKVSIAEQLSYKNTLILDIFFNKYKILKSKNVRFDFKENYFDALFEWLQDTLSILLIVKNASEYSVEDCLVLNNQEKKFITSECNVDDIDLISKSVMEKFMLRLNEHNIVLEGELILKVEKEIKKGVKGLLK